MTRGSGPHAESASEQRHVALVGFMGAGKSTVGKLLAERLNVAFVDLDELIAKNAGHTIVEIFREHGELGFRAHERAALRELLKNDKPLVIATGGGTFVDASMRTWLQRDARTVYLKASVETLWARLSQGTARGSRPLLAGPDPLATMQRMLRDRTPAYEQAEVTIEVETSPSDMLIEQIARALRTGHRGTHVTSGAGNKESPGTTGRAHPAPTTHPGAGAAKGGVRKGQEPPPPQLPASRPHQERSSRPSAPLRKERPAQLSLVPEAMPEPSSSRAAPSEPARTPQPSAHRAAPSESLRTPRPLSHREAPSDSSRAVQNPSSLAPRLDSPRGALSAAAKAPTPLDDDHDKTRAADDGSALLRVQSRQGVYPVELHREAGPWIADAICTVLAGKALAIITDTNVEPLHAAHLRDALASRGRQVTIHSFPAGEEHKSLETVAELYDALLTAGLGRKDGIVALGGGVVGDVAGFVASTFLRGLAHVQVPTTTLAATDASVGGKTGVNTPRGKNLVGAFHAPRAVLIAAAHLATQQPRAHLAGLAEAVKMAATMDDELFEMMAHEARPLAAGEPRLLLHTLAQAIALKAGVVGRDELEQGERAVLNFGHTVGHAIEMGEELELLHGEAVGLGMLAEAAFAETEGWARDVVAPLAGLLGDLGLPTDWQSARIDMSSLWLDKKRVREEAVMPVVQRLGTFELRAVSLAQLTRFLEDRSQ